MPFTHKGRKNKRIKIKRGSGGGCVVKGSSGKGTKYSNEDYHYLSVAHVVAS